LKNHFGGSSTEIKNTYTKRSPLGHYFLLPNEIFALGLSPGELSVYAYLVFCENRETHQCWPSIGRISQHTGMSANTVAKYIRQLEEKRLIDTQPTKVKTRAGLVRNGNLLYMIRPIQEAVNYKLEKDLAALPEQKRPREKR
jgi:DNA-binding MarR family transcriptional regulator